MDQEIKEPVITGVSIDRHTTYNDIIAKPGCKLWVFSFIKDGVLQSPAPIQISTDWEDGNDVRAYIKRVYIYKKDVEVKKPSFKNRAGKSYTLPGGLTSDQKGRNKYATRSANSGV